MIDSDSTIASSVQDRDVQHHLSQSLLITMAAASGVAVANIYYNQPMLADMARTFNVSVHEIGFVATATQVGYAAGMPLFIPLGDFIERRRLIITLFVAVACALACAALSTTLQSLIVTSFLIGVTSVIAQIIVPLASDLAAPKEQGRTIGTIISGVLLGILLARTLSGVVSHHLGWRAMYWLASGMAIAFSVLLRFALPKIHSRSTMTYPQLMRSTLGLALHSTELWRVASIAALFFASFSAFWTTLVFLLETPPYHYGSQAAGMFGLVGAISVGVAPIVGKLYDRRGHRFVATIAIGTVVAAYAVFEGFGFRTWGLVIGVLLLDAGTQGAQVANQSRAFSLHPEARNRVNTIYMIFYFGGASLGSLLGTWAWDRWQWPGVCAVGFGCMAAASCGLFLRKTATD